MAAERRIGGIYPKELVQTWQLHFSISVMVGLNSEMLQAAYIIIGSQPWPRSPIQSWPDWWRE